MLIAPLCHQLVVYYVCMWLGAEHDGAEQVFLQKQLQAAAENNADESNEIEPKHEGCRAEYLNN